MDFGRPTLLVVSAEGETVLITPTMEQSLAESLAVVDRIEPGMTVWGLNGEKPYPASWGQQRRSG